MGEEKKTWNPKTRTFDIVMVPKQDKPEEKKSRKTKSKSRSSSSKKSEEEVTAEPVAATEESSVDIVQQRKQRHEEKKARSKSREEAQAKKQEKVEEPKPVAEKKEEPKVEEEKKEEPKPDEQKKEEPKPEEKKKSRSTSRKMKKKKGSPSPAKAVPTGVKRSWNAKTRKFDESPLEPGDEGYAEWQEYLQEQEKLKAEEAAKKTEEVKVAVVQETVASVTETVQHTEVVQKSEESSAQVVVQAEKVVEPVLEEPKPLKTFVQKVWDNDAKDFKEITLTGEEAEKAEKAAEVANKLKSRSRSRSKSKSPGRAAAEAGISEEAPAEEEFEIKKVWNNSTKTFEEVKVKVVRNESKSRKAKSKSKSKSGDRKLRSKSQSPERSDGKQSRGRSVTKKSTQETSFEESSETSGILKQTRSSSTKKISFLEDQDEGPVESPIVTFALLPQSAEVGSSATFECKFAGSPAPSVFWFVNDKRVELTNRDYEYTTDKAGKTTCKTTCTKKTVNEEDDGAVFRCVIENKAGEAQSSATLRVVKKSEHTKTETTVVQNEDGSQVTQTRTETHSVTQSGTGFSISQTSETTVVQETKQATAEGLFDSTSASNTDFEDDMQEEKVQPPTFHEKLAPTKVNHGETILLSCGLTGSFPMDITWSRDGKTIKQETAHQTNVKSTLEIKQATFRSMFQQLEHEMYNISCRQIN